MAVRKRVNNGQVMRLGGAKLASAEAKDLLGLPDEADWRLDVLELAETTQRFLDGTKLIKIEEAMVGQLILCPRARPDQGELNNVLYLESVELMVGRVEKTLNAEGADLLVKWLAKWDLGEDALIDSDLFPLAKSVVFDNEIPESLLVLKPDGIAAFVEGYELLSGKQVNGEEKKEKRVKLNEDQGGECVEVVARNKGRVVLPFSVKGLGERMYLCTSKEGTVRMKVVGGLLRVMSDPRVKEFIDDLQVDPEDWLRKAREYSVQLLKDESPFATFGNLQALIGIPAQELSACRKEVLIGHWFINDWSKVSLMYFLPSSMPVVVWSRRPSVEGRKCLQAMVEYVELFYVIHFHAAFQGSLSKLLATFRTGVYLTKDDMYVRARLEALFASFTSDVYRRAESAQFIAQSMEGGEECAALLRLYVDQYVDQLAGKSVGNNWTDSPHHVWYMDGQGFSLIQGTNKKVEIDLSRDGRGTGGFQQQLGKVTPAVEESNDALCVWHVSNLVGVKDPKTGRAVECHYSFHRGPGCKAHRTMAEVTKAEAVAAVQTTTRAGPEMRAKMEEKVRAAVGWKA